MKLVKFLNSAQLFKFCQKVLGDQKGKKVHDQDVGSILNFNPSDCSHWKKGEKNVKSVFALEKLANALKVEISLIYDLASGTIGLDEAYFEYQESRNFENSYKKAKESNKETLMQCRQRIYQFVESLHQKADFKTPPLYLPEVLRFFPFITIQQIEMMDKLSRVLRTKPGQYLIQYRKGELKPQTRMSVALDLARIVLDGERERFQKELGPVQESLVPFERMIFVAALLCPQNLFASELSKADPRKNLVSELASLFWVPKSLVGFQIQDSIRFHQVEQRHSIPTPRASSSLSL